jgi:uncharacterized cofD-like protein
MNSGPLPLSSAPTPAAAPSTSGFHVVAIGGGTGLPTVLRGLRAHDHLSHAWGPYGSRDAITAIVTVTDDGGSSGRLCRELGILPPGDVRNCLAALAPDESSFTTLLQHRFSSGDGLDGHTVGNLMLAALTEIDGDFLSAVEKMSDLLECCGRVLPSSVERVSLCAELDGGVQVEGETAIVARGKRIARLALQRRVRPLPESLRAIVNATAIVVGPGSLYTSVLPNLLVDGIAPTIAGVAAVRIFVANLMTQPGETDDLTLEDHLEAIRRHVGGDLFDYVLVNRQPPTAEALARYTAAGSQPVRRASTSPWIGSTRIVERDLAWDASAGKVRHDPDDLAAAIIDLISAGRPHTARVHRLSRHVARTRAR